MVDLQKCSNSLNITLESNTRLRPATTRTSRKFIYDSNKVKSSQKISIPAKGKVRRCHLWRGKYFLSIVDSRCNSFKLLAKSTHLQQIANTNFILNFIFKLKTF